MTAATVAKHFKIIDQDTFRMGVAVIKDDEWHKFWDAETYFTYCYMNNISTTHFLDGTMTRPMSALNPSWVN